MVGEGSFSVGSPQSVKAQAVRRLAPVRLAALPSRFSLSIVYASKKFLACRSEPPSVWSS